MLDPVYNVVFSNLWFLYAVLGGTALGVALWALWNKRTHLMWYAAAIGVTILTLDVTIRAMDTAISTAQINLRAYSHGLIVYSTSLWLFTLAFMAATIVLVILAVRKYEHKLGMLASLAVLAVLGTMAAECSYQVGTFLNNGSVSGAADTVEEAFMWGAIVLLGLLAIIEAELGRRWVKQWNTTRTRKVAMPPVATTDQRAGDRREAG